MMRPDTCSVGYNNFVFDDEFSRHLFYRNFLDVYGREYLHGNSRFDLINLVRMCYALRPEGIEWPRHESGRPSFRLEDLTAANGIEHEGAHDALVDVRATLAFARLLRDRQPRLWTWALGLRDQHLLRKLLDTAEPRPLLHSSGRISASRGCTTLVLPLAEVPKRKEVIVYDLAEDPAPLLELDAADIADRVFTAQADLPPGTPRIPLKTVRLNRSPMLAPLPVLREVDEERIDLDPVVCRRHAERILPHLTGLRPRLLQVFERDWGEPAGDPDGMLYSGGFFPAADRKAMAEIARAGPERLREGGWRFQDPRLPEMLFRLRARNYPESLSAEEGERWEEERLARLHAGVSARQLDEPGFRAELADARRERGADGSSATLLDAVEAWARDLLRST
jgi:exodeoxyribonuclease-1